MIARSGRFFGADRNTTVCGLPSDEPVSPDRGRRAVPEIGSFRENQERFKA
jgi:hypothetical protein